MAAVPGASLLRSARLSAARRCAACRLPPARRPLQPACARHSPALTQFPLSPGAKPTDVTQRSPGPPPPPLPPPAVKGATARRRSHRPSARRPPQRLRGGGQAPHTLGVGFRGRFPSAVARLSPQPGAAGGWEKLAMPHPWHHTGVGGSPNMGPLLPCRGHRPSAALGEPHPRAPGPTAMAVDAKRGVQQEGP